jgi:hypothetical protein
MDKKPMTMTVDTFDVFWFLTIQAIFVLLGIDAAGIWFFSFTWVVIMWFREPLGDWLGERAARKMREEIHKELSLN